MIDFEDDVALVTGAAGGIGSATTVAFADAGASVVAADVDDEGLAATAALVEDETDGDVTTVTADVTDSAEVRAMVETAVDTYGGLDAAVNNAAIAGEQGPITDYPEPEFERVIDVNLTGVWRSLQAELGVMESGGIVNVSSVLGKAGYQDAGAYVAAKHGVVGLTKTAAQECADGGIRVNAVCPGFTETSMLDAAGVNVSERVRKYVRGLHPMERFGDPAEIAAAAVWLCSDAASFVTGTALPVDGGYLSK